MRSIVQLLLLGLLSTALFSYASAQPAGNVRITASAETIQLGEMAVFSVVVENLSDVEIESIDVSVSSELQPFLVAVSKVESLGAGEIYVFVWNAFRPYGLEEFEPVEGNVAFTFNGVEEVQAPLRIEPAFELEKQPWMLYLLIVLAVAVLFMELK